MTNGSSYSITVKAINAKGDSDLSMLPLTIAGSPDSPTNVVATSADESIAVRWVAPVENGGSAITGYSLCANAICVDVAPSVRSSSIPGLTNRVPYVVKVRAVTAYGVSDPATGGSVVRTPPLMLQISRRLSPETVRWRSLGPLGIRADHP